MSSPQDPESHWATRGVIAWLRVPRFAKYLAVTGAISLTFSVMLSAITISGTRTIDRFSTPTEEGCPVDGSNVAGGEDPWGGCFPGPGNTGIPSGTSLTTYAGANPVTVDGTTITGKIFADRLIVNADNVTVTNSRLTAGVEAWVGDNFTITDSEVNADNIGEKALEGEGFTALRNEIDGKAGNSGGWCFNCVLTDNWIHNSTVLAPDSEAHMSGYRMRQDGTFTHNTIACEVAQSAAGGSCSAGLTGYGDDEPVQNNTIDSNLFVATPGSYCTYGGSSGGKPYSSGTNNIVFTDNVFQRGSNDLCGFYAPVGDWNGSKPGNSATGNVWDDGSPLTFP